jgi:hypothetical protein
LDRYADEAARLCGHLPLALEVFAGAVNDRRLYPVPELLDRLGRRVDKLAPVDATFEVSYELLSEEMRRRWTVLAVFPASFELSAAAELWKLEAHPALEAMQALVNSSLVQCNKSARRFRLHDLVRRFCYDRRDEEEHTAAVRCYRLQSMAEARKALDSAKEELRIAREAGRAESLVPRSPALVPQDLGLFIENAVARLARAESALWNDDT